MPSNGWKTWYVWCVCRESKEGYEGLVADEYAVLSKALWSGQYRSVAPRDFRVCPFFVQLFICCHCWVISNSVISGYQTWLWARRPTGLTMGQSAYRPGLGLENYGNSVVRARRGWKKNWWTRLNWTKATFGVQDFKFRPNSAFELEQMVIRLVSYDIS